MTPDQLSAALLAADTAHTLAVQTAAQTGVWGMVAPAAAAVHQARAALVGTEPEGTK